jgi:hypothetical protein
LEVTSHQGRQFANWRKWFSGDDGEWKATREGCTFPLETLGALTASLMEYHGLEPPEALDSAS